MTQDEKIEKALSCCSQPGIHLCKECPYDDCSELNKDALEYIKRLKSKQQPLQMQNVIVEFARFAEIAFKQAEELVSAFNDVKIKKHIELCAFLHDTYKAKNADYGNSFSEMFAEFGIITAVTRIGDKFNRLKNLCKNQQRKVKDESIKDTLLDIANYCIMTAMEIDNQNNTKSGGKK